MRSSLPPELSLPPVRSPPLIASDCANACCIPLDVLSRSRACGVYHSQSYGCWRHVDRLDLRGGAQQHGTVVYLHGVADNRESSVGIIRRFVPRGSPSSRTTAVRTATPPGTRAPTAISNETISSRILDTVATGRIVLVGRSLGAAVALQDAAHDPRVTAIVAIAPFSDLKDDCDRTRACPLHERHHRPRVRARRGGRPFPCRRGQSGGRRALDYAPVLLVHGAADVDTPLAHSERILAALTGPKRLLLVPGIGHNERLPDSTWDEIERWVLPAAVPMASAAVTRPR